MSLHTQQLLKRGHEFEREQGACRRNWREEEREEGNAASLAFTSQNTEYSQNTQHYSVLPNTK